MYIYIYIVIIGEDSGYIGIMDTKIEAAILGLGLEG